MQKNILQLLNNLIVILLLLVLSGCGGNSACIDADDFGFTTVSVSARADGKVVGQGANQVSQWQDSELLLSGKVVVVMIKNWNVEEDFNSKKATSAWCPWWGTKSYPQTLAPYCKRLKECIYLNNEPCYSTPPHTISAADGYEYPAIVNAPCIMKKGMGLYANLQPRNGPHPNASLVSMKNPPNITIHAGEPTFDSSTPNEGFKFFDFSGKGNMREAGGFRFNYDGSHDINSTRLNYVNGKLYFKILDSYYEDNSGQYIAVIKSGLYEPGGDLFTLIRRLVRERLFGTGDPDDTTLDKHGVVRTIFQNIVTTPGYINAIRAALILYVTITGVMFLMGTIQLTHGEVVNRMVKISIITVLLTPTISWDFFNDYLFIWMYEGSNFLVKILTDAADSGPGDSSILTFLTSHQIMAKLASLLFSTWQGFIYIIIYFIMLIFLTKVMFDATILFLTAQIMIGLLISLAPIFIAFYLFESTKSFFDNWLKQMIGYAIQSVIVSAGILFMTLIIRNQIYNTLGFRVCLHEFPDMNVAGGGSIATLAQGIDPDPGEGLLISIFAWWFPHIQSAANAPGLERILIPKAHFVTSGSSLGFGVGPQDLTPAPGHFCPAYACVGLRHPDLPFLDPTNPAEARQMQLLRSDQIIDWGGIFIILVCVYLLHHFNSTTVSISKFLSQTTGNQTDLSGAAQIISQNTWGESVNKLDKYSGFKGIRASFNKKRAELRNKALGMVQKKTSNLHAEILRRQALHGPAAMSSDVYKKAITNTGLTHDDVRGFKNNRTAHMNALKAAGMKSRNAGRFLDEYGNKSNREIDQLLAKHQFKKKLSQMSKEELAKLDEMKGGLGDMMSDKRRADLFQDAYVDAYKDLAEGSAGMGALSKARFDIESRREKNQSYLDELSRYGSNGMSGGKFNEMKYSDDMRRTQNEIIADKDRLLNDKATRLELDAKTVKAGTNVMRPDYLAKQKEMGVDNSDLYNLIKQNIFNDVHHQLHDSGHMMGDTYIREKMDDDSFETMITTLEDDAERLIKDHDQFLKQSEIYEKGSAEWEEVQIREKMINEAIEAETNRLKEVKYGNQPEKNNLHGDMKKAGNKVKGWFTPNK